MFCPSCGSENTIGLPYCNRCGANLGALTAQPEIIQVNVTKPALIIGTLLAVLTLGGFVALIAGALSLAQVLHANDPPIAVIFFGMIIILTVDIFLVRQLSKLITASLSSNAPAPKQGNALPNRPPVQLQPPLTARLQQATSVTENTTRFFEPSYGAPSETESRSSTQDIERLEPGARLE